MISNILPAAVGNAIKIFLVPPASAVSWSLLRNLSGAFAGQDDSSAAVIFSGNGETYFLDVFALVNGTRYYYGVFYFDGTGWTPGNVASATPSVSYADRSVDVLSIVRDRLDVGLQNEVALGTLTPACGVIAVLNAPPVFEETNWPVITVHVVNDASGARAIGEMIFPDEFDPVASLWNESQGWLARVQLTVVGWSKNPDERIALRKALRKIVIGNLEVFDSVGMINIDFSQSDVDELSAYPAPVYQSMCSFSCEAPAGVAVAADLVPEAPTATPIPVF